MLEKVRTETQAKHLAWCKSHRNLRNASARRYRERHPTKFSEWARSHRDLRNAARKRYVDSHKEEVRKQLRRWYLDNKETIKLKRANYYLSHKSECNKRSRDFHKRTYESNRKEILIKTKEYSKLHPDVARKSNQNFRRNHPDKARANDIAKRARKKLGFVSKEQNGYIKAFLNCLKEAGQSRCVYCSKMIPFKDIQIDHIVPFARGGKHEINNVIHCCKSCNSSKKSKLLSEWKGLGK